MNQNATLGRSRAAQPAGQAPRTQRFETLDSWRGICALLVAMMHFPASGFVSESPLVRHAWLFVDYFFVLSGFVIAHGYGRKLTSGSSTLKFVALRLGRIYPLHLAVLALFVLYEGARLAVPALRGQGAAPFTDGNTLHDLVVNLLLLNGVGFEDRLTWNGPSWSISAEVWTYVLFGAAVLFLGRRLWIALVAAILAGPVVIYLYSPDFMDATWHLGLVRCIYGFALGALLYRLSGLGNGAVREGPKPYDDKAVWTVFELSAIALVAAFVGWSGHDPASIAAPFVFAPVILVFAQERGHVSSLLRTRAFLWLGALSYSIYMVHIFVQARMINAGTVAGKFLHATIVGPFEIRGEAFYGFGVQGALFGTLTMVAMVAAVVATALVAHLLVEKPCQRLVKRWLSASPAPRNTNVHFARLGMR